MGCLENVATHKSIACEDQVVWADVLRERHSDKLSLNQIYLPQAGGSASGLPPSVSGFIAVIHTANDELEEERFCYIYGFSILVGTLIFLGSDLHREPQWITEALLFTLIAPHI